MSRQFLFLLTVAVIGTGWATAGEPARGKTTAAQRATAERASRLVSALASDDFETRERAARELETMGPVIGPALQKALANPDPEVRRLARDLAGKVARKLEAAEVLEPKRLRLAFRDVPLHIAVQEFMRVTGAQIQLNGVKSNTRKITLDTGYTGFWDAFDKFCAAAGLSEKTFDTPEGSTQENPGYQVYSGRRRVMWNSMGMAQQQEEIIPALPNGRFILTDAKPAPRSIFQAGALRFRTLPAGTNLGQHSSLKGDNELVFGLEVIPAPSLAWEKVQTLRIERAIDDQGQSLVARHARTNDDAPANEWERDVMGFYSGDVYGNGGTGIAGQRVPLRLVLGRKPSTVLKELTGVATVKMQTSTQAIATIDHIMTAADKSAKAADGSYLKVVELKAEADGRLVLQVKVDQPQQEEANFNPWGWRSMMWRGQQEGEVDNSVSTGSLVLFDARGNLVRLVAKEPIPDDNGLKEEYRFVYQMVKGQPAAAKLVLQGRRDVTIDVPFTLRDVPLKAPPGTKKPSSPPPPSPQGQLPQSEIGDW